MLTAITGLSGGMLIGASAGTLLLFNGNILGASGISNSCILSARKTFSDANEQWKLVFLASFMLTSKAIINFMISEESLIDPNVGTDPNLAIVSALGHAVAGFLVGFGTRLGNGCTTGHGICGLARLSIRSFVGVASFMSFGIFSATMCSPDCVLAQFLRTDKSNVKYALPNDQTKYIGSLLTALSVAMAVPAFFRSCSHDDGKDENKINNQRKLIPAGVSAVLFSLGLNISQMTMSSKIYGFLDMKGLARGTHDATLLFVMGGGFLISFISYQFVKGFNVINNNNTISCPLALKKSSGKFSVPSSKVIDFQLIFGEALFGLGWGIGGICPGPAIFLAAAGFPHLIYRWWPSFLAGSFIAQKVKDRLA